MFESGPQTRSIQAGLPTARAIARVADPVGPEGDFGDLARLALGQKFRDRLAWVKAVESLPGSPIVKVMPARNRVESAETTW